MVAGSKYRGEFEERVQQILKEVTAEQDRMVLFIDEIHTIVGAGQGGGEGGLDIANTFKPALARGELNLIGATTLNEYQKHIEKDAALERRFQPVLVPEPTVAQTIMILRGLRDTLEAHHKVDDHRRGDHRRGRALRPLRHRALPARQGDRPHRPGGGAGEDLGDGAPGRRAGPRGRGAPAQARDTTTRARARISSAARICRRSTTPRRRSSRRRRSAGGASAARARPRCAPSTSPRWSRSSPASR